MVWIWSKSAKKRTGTNRNITKYRTHEARDISEAYSVETFLNSLHSAIYQFKREIAEFGSLDHLK